MDVVMDFGSEPVKDVDTKLQILKFSYSWIEEVEKEERLMKEVTEPDLVQAVEQKNECKVKTLRTETKEIPRETVLDFGDRPVRDLDEKLEILKFPYSWVEVVEEEERRAKEDDELTVEQTNKEAESNVKIFREETNEIPREPILNFGEEPVTNLEEKLEILKFPYKWADIVEEEEIGTKEPSMFNKAIQQEGRDHEKVTQEDEPKEEIAPNNISSKPQDIPQALKAEIDTDKETKDLEATCSKAETQQMKLEFLNNDEDENDNCFVPRKLFLFGVVEFKRDLKRPNKNVEQPKISEKPTDALNSTYESVGNVTSVKKRIGIGRKIKAFLGIR